VEEDRRDEHIMVAIEEVGGGGGSRGGRGVAQGRRPSGGIGDEVPVVASGMRRRSWHRCRDR
jgi:hypothetical protein